MRLFKSGDTVPEWLQVVAVDGKQDQNALKFGAVCLVINFMGTFFLCKIFGKSAFKCDSIGNIIIEGQGNGVYVCSGVWSCLKAMYSLKKSGATS